MTPVERAQAEKFIIADRGPLKPKVKKKTFKVHEQVSPCEKAIMMEFKSYDRKTKMIESNLLSPSNSQVGIGFTASTGKFQAISPPLSTAMEQLQDPSVGVREDRLSEWEKSHFEKIFKSLDDFAKTKLIKRESLLKLWEVMEKDETYLGKIPMISKEEFNNIVAIRLKDKKELGYLTFRKLLDDFGWRKLNKSETQGRVDKLYHTANVYLREGKSQDAINECAKALSLSRYH